MSAGLVVRLSWTANEPSALPSAGVCCCPEEGRGRRGGKGGDVRGRRRGEGKRREGKEGSEGKEGRGGGGSEGTVEMEERGGLLAMTWLP